MEDLKEIITEIVGYKKTIKGFNPSDDTILECSTRIFNTGRMHYGETASDNPENAPMTGLATKKQKDWMDKHKVKYPKEITKLEASKLIEEKINLEKQKKEEQNEY